MNWKFWKKEGKKEIEDNTSEYTNEELELMHEKANVEAIKIYNKIFCLFKEHINELKEGDNFILLQENHINLCDDKELNDIIIFDSIFNYNKLYKSIPELHIIYGKLIKGMNDINLGYEEYYMYTITITHDDIIENYDIKFKVYPPMKQINNGNGICVTIHGINKNIYKIIS